jgi:vacuolar-type H+-ATPase subunit F/Vma7
MSAIEIIGDRETVLAFGLGGVPGHVVASSDEARAALDALVRAYRGADRTRRDVTLVLVTQRAADGMRDVLNRLVFDAQGPLVLEVPGFGDPRHDDPLARFVDRVLGVRR